MNTVDILINHGIVVTMDSERRIVDDGSVAIEKDKIVDIGPTGELQNQYSAGEVIDATQMLVLPGLINGHTHAGFSLGRGVGDDLSLLEAHDKVYAPLTFSSAVSPEDIYLGTLLSCVEYIRTGSTCIVDQYAQPQEVARAVETAGIRGVLSPMMIDSWPGEEKPSFLQDRKEVIDDAVDLIKNWNGEAEGRIRCWFGPMHEMSATKEMLLEVVALAKQYNVGIHVHLAETLAQVDAIKKSYGKRSIEYAYDLGVLRPGTVAAHCCWLSAHDITLLAQSGASVAHTPTTEMKISDGIEPAPRLLEAGVNVSLGTDSSAQCNGSSDLVQEMKTAALLHKVNYPLDPGVITAERLLEMVTVNGAKAVMWYNEIGSLEKGKKADVILVDLKKPHLTPLLRQPKLNAVNLFVYSAVGDDVDTMIVNGKIIMLHRKILTLDEAQVMAEAQEAAERLIERSGVAKETFPWTWSLK